mmetsp:Transcript_13609/g.20626  ORF Transcript_13609/g.20626 Transcript_13609/m.20626 type:complete len:191 (+) Transcript_13609:1138-1710(+)
MILLLDHIFVSLSDDSLSDIFSSRSEEELYLLFLILEICCLLSPHCAAYLGLCDGSFLHKLFECSVSPLASDRLRLSSMHLLHVSVVQCWSNASFIFSSDNCIYHACSIIRPSSQRSHPFPSPLRMATLELFLLLYKILQHPDGSYSSFSSSFFALLSVYLGRKMLSILRRGWNGLDSPETTFSMLDRLL